MAISCPKIFGVVTIAACTVLLLIRAGDALSTPREKMVSEQIEARGIRDGNVLRAMRATPRHLFVPSVFRLQAYEDGPLPIGYGATISQPFVVAWMTELLQPGPTDRVLEIGTGSGYQSAVLSCLARSVYTIEILPELAQSATKRLAELGYRNVIVREGNGYEGWVKEAPFDRIILTAAAKDIPTALLGQLAPRGRLVGPVGTGFFQKLTVVDKPRSGPLRVRSMGEVGFVPMVPR
ncbi:MAG: protein-L-isoaspartate(D-aspartate) O-methyltransferase [Bryobacteraceae bacterium]